MHHPRLLQIFNETVCGGGLDLAVARMRSVLSGTCDFRECVFHSADWVGPRAPSIPRQALLLLHNPAALRRILAAHRELAADAWIVHNWEPVVSAGIYAAAHRAGVPIVQIVHNFRPFSVNSYLWVGGNLPIAAWRRNFLREVMAGSWQSSRLKTAWLALVTASLHWRGHFGAVKAWVGVSEFMRDQFIEAGLPAADVFALRHSWQPLGLPTEAAEADYYLFLGRLIDEKGVRVLLAAWELVARRAGADAPRLIIAGEGPLAGWVVEQAQGNPLIAYRGVVAGEAKRSLLAGCRAVIAPSLWREAMGFVVYEAFDQAKPVLAARSGGCTEIVQASKGGFLHEPGSAAELAQQVLHLERQAGERRRLGCLGREWLLTNASEDEWRRRFLEIVAHAVRRADDHRATRAEPAKGVVPSLL